MSIKCEELKKMMKVGDQRIKKTKENTNKVSRMRRYN